MILYLSTSGYVPGCTEYVLQFTIPDVNISIMQIPDASERVMLACRQAGYMIFCGILSNNPLKSSFSSSHGRQGTEIKFPGHRPLGRARNKVKVVPKLGTEIHFPQHLYIPPAGPAGYI